MSILKTLTRMFILVVALEAGLLIGLKLYPAVTMVTGMVIVKPCSRPASL